MKHMPLLVSIVFLFCTTSCEKYLSENPISSYNAGGFYRTQSDFKLAINGLYANLRDISYYQVIFLESRSDNTKGRQLGSENQTFNLLSTFTENPSSTLIIDFWTKYWQIINQSNKILATIDQAKFDDLTLLNFIKGEAYFMRGYAYFELGWMWGGMPIIKEEVTTQELANIKRSEQSETLSFAEENFLKAIELLPEVWNTTYLGKATKYTAEGYLARLYMFNAKFDNAIPLLEKIIQSGKYKIAASYQDIFSEAFDNSPEHVFQVQFQAGTGGQSINIPYYLFGPYKHQYFPNGSSPGIFVSPDLYNSYEAGDLRRDFTIAKDLYNFSGVLNQVDMFSIKFARGLNTSNYKNYGLNFPLLRYTDILLLYSEALNETQSNRTVEIGTIINSVRTRAGLGNINTSGLSKEALRQTIFKERRLEFAFEGIRWFDLIRTKVAYAVINNFLSSPAEGNGTYKMREYQTLFPIPQQEININPNTAYMWQNPGY